MHLKFLVVLIFTLFSQIVFAQSELAIVAVGEATLEVDKIQIPNAVVQGGDATAASTIVSVLRSDFGFYKKNFEVISSGSPSKSANWSDLTSRGIRYALQLTVTPGGYELSLFDSSNRSEILSLRGSMGGQNERTLAHQLAQQAFKKITNKDSIFESKMIFVSDKDARGEEVKELYMMDFDGGNKRRLTHHKGTVISPAISHDGKRVLYSLIDGGKKERNVNLLMMDLATGNSEVISNRPGINSGAVFMPDNESIALTLSHTGQADLYVMNLQTKALRRLTNHPSPDVDPSINRDGSLMTFLSGRSGAAMIYTMNPLGTEQAIKRISFVGHYNATPRFSPDGSEIAFSSWLDNRFDIFRIGSDGNHLSRLTKDFGSNEDPTFSPDGQFIAFRSQRVLSRTSAVQSIYIMDRDGEILGNITENFGNCLSPRWSKY